MEPRLGAPKFAILEKYKFAESEHIVHQRKKFRKQKSSVTMSYIGSGQNFLPQVKSWSARGKLIFRFLGLKDSAKN